MSEQRFRNLYEATYRDLLRFVQRRVGPADAEKLVGDVMLTAWRCLDDVPDDPVAARVWLFRLSRKVVPTTVRLAEAERDRVVIVSAWSRLTPAEQETLALAKFDRLSARDAGAVLGIGSVRFRLRLTRAWSTLRHLVEVAQGDETLAELLTSDRSSSRRTPSGAALTVAALRELDPAPATELTDAERERAEAMLTRILDTPADAPLSVVPDRKRPVWLRARVLVPLGLVLVAGATVPAVALNREPDLPSPPPKAVALTQAEAADALKGCRAEYRPNDPRNKFLIAAKRGEWAYVSFTSSHGSGYCIVSPAHGLAIGGYGQGRDPAPKLRPDQIGGFGGGAGVYQSGWLVEDRQLNEASGFVGENVTGVTVHTMSGDDIEATVSHGQFAAWWPSGVQSSSHPEGFGPESYTVILADGSTRKILEHDCLGERGC